MLDIPNLCTWHPTSRFGVRAREVHLAAEIMAQGSAPRISTAHFANLDRWTTGVLLEFVVQLASANL